MREEVSNFKVTDKKTFIEFIDLLRADLLANPDDWENKKMDDFLEAVSRFTEDIQVYYENTNQSINTNQASWQLFADIFKGSSIYE